PDHRALYLSGTSDKTSNAGTTSLGNEDWSFLSPTDVGPTLQGGGDGEVHWRLLEANHASVGADSRKQSGAEQCRRLCLADRRLGTPGSLHDPGQQHEYLLPDRTEAVA